MNIKSDLKKLLAESGWTVLRLASEAGVSKDSLYRLLRGERGGVNSTTLEKLWPFLYGDRRPAAADDAA